MDRPFQGIGWLPQIGSVWAGADRSQDKGDAGRADPVPVSQSRGRSRAARREPRSAAVLTFAVCGLAGDGRFFVELSSTINVSRSGCCVWLRRRPLADSALALREVSGGASLPRGASHVLFQVAWVRPEAGGWLVGASALGQADLLSGSRRFPS